MIVPKLTMLENTVFMLITANKSNQTKKTIICLLTNKYRMRKYIYEDGKNKIQLVRWLKKTSYF